MQQLPPGFQLEQAPAPRSPGVIRGPLDVPSERRAEEDQAMQRERDARQAAIEAERLRIAQMGEQRQADESARNAELREKGFDSTEGERKAAAFLIRALGANTTYEGSGVGPRGLIDQTAKDAFPNVTNYFTSGERQAAESAQDEFIAASLRQDSGAAIPEEELERQRRIYFPMPGDGPEALEQKRQARLRAIAGLEQSSGRLLPQTLQTWNREGVSALQLALESGRTKEEILEIARANRLDVDEAALDANIRSRDEGGPVSGFIPPEGNDPTPPSGGGSTLETIGEGLAQGVGNVVQGAGDTIGIVTDPIARALADALGYDGSQLPSAGTAMREGLGLPQSAPGINRMAQEFAGGALFGGVAARGLAAAASPGITQNALSVMGRTPVRDTVAGAGAGAGASIGQDVGGTPGAIGGALLGGIGGYSAANRLAGVTAGSQPNALAQASQRQGVDILPADAGGPVARAVTTGTRASPISVAPVANAAERQQQQFGDATRRVAATQGEVLDTQQAGEAIRRGSENYIEQSRARGNRLYERAATQSRGVKIKPNMTVQAAREALVRMRENPATTPGEVSSLESFINNIEDGVSVQGLRDARTKLSESVYDGNLRSGSDQAMWKGILSNVADDIDAGLRSVGRDDAANTFRTADKLWSERIEMIDKVLQPIVGKEGARGGEQILQAIESAARGQSGGNARLSRILGAMPAEEAGNVRATIVDRLGRATPGAQDAQGEAFSAATFLTNWNKMTPQAKASLFADKGLRDDLSDLAKLAEGTKQGQSMTNWSNTGVAVNSANLVTGVAGAATNLPLTLLGGGALYLTGKLMASPRFARILARTSKMPPEAANRTFREQVAILSTRQPQLAGDLERLTKAINDNSRLAAQEGETQE